MVSFLKSNAQDFMLQGWYWDYPKTCNGYNWANTLNSKATQISSAGFTYVWLPPLTRASFGNCSNGYDPKDLYDLGEYGGGATGFGTRADLNNLIANFNSKNIQAVADVVYNHRDGGKAENNSAVKDYITDYMSAVKNAFPSDRYRCILPVGGSTGNNAGDYYFKIKSKTQDGKYFNKNYTVYMQTNKKGWQSLPDTFEYEPNGGGDCGQGNNSIVLGRNWKASIDYAGCKIDEFHLNLSSNDFNATNDTIFIYLTNPDGDYTDHYIYGLWSGNANADIVGQVVYQTYTDFSSMSSGQGAMNFENFKPNSVNKSSTYLQGDWDWLWFFYDYDQFQSDTKIKLFDWSNWLWTDVGIRGYRMDAVKHFTEEFVGDLMDDLHSKGKNPGIVVGEYFDTNPFVLKSWVDEVHSKMDNGTKAAINVRAFDFDLRQALKDVCDYNADSREIFVSGMVDAAGASGFDVITFLNNHDYRDVGQPIQNNTILAYAYLLTNNQIGLPCVFYPEYFGETVPNYPNINLQSQIDGLMDVHQKYIFGASSRDYLNRFSTPYSGNFISGSTDKSLIYQLSGSINGKEVVVAINFSGQTLKLDQGVNMSKLVQGDTLFDVLGNSNFPYALVSNSNQIYIELPPNSYSVWVQGKPLVLPIEMGNFNVEKRREDVLVQWNTLNETNVKSFEIERSVDGLHFNKIGSQLALNKPSTYIIKDINVPKGITIYYRIRTIEMNQSSSYSGVKSVFMQDDFSIKLYPNPADEMVQIEINSKHAKDILIKILDLNGVLKIEKACSTEKGLMYNIISIAGLPSGIYIVQFIDDNCVKSMKLLKI